MPDVKGEHSRALLFPSTPEEGTIAMLFHELAVLSDRHKDDSVLLPAVEHLGSAILILLNGEVGRIDQASMDKQVRDTVLRAGGNVHNL